MNNNLNTLLTTLYVTLVDDVLPSLGINRTHRPGRKPALDDAELLCLVIAQHLLHGTSSETRWVRYAHQHLSEMFPAIPQQSGYNKRVRAASSLISLVITALARDTASWYDLCRLLDSTPVPCAMSTETVKRSDLAGYANYGYCASHSRYFWGFRLYLVCTPDGMPVIWGLADPKIGEREAAMVLLAHDQHLLSTGQVIVADKGFAGCDFERFISYELGVELIRPDRKNEAHRYGDLGGIRQWVESVFDTLKDQLGLEHHRARSPGGVYAKVAGKLLALASVIWHNWRIGAPDKRSLTAYDH